ncbi:MAG: hypothetical protein L6Q49_14130 [Anaerolineales bacterium]|nr:hypothetical protein [Anaerolineales bacterium]
MNKRNNLVGTGAILILILQLACTIVDVLPDYFCEMNGGTWHPSTIDEDAWCEKAKPNPEATPEAGETTPAGNEAEENPPAEGTEEYIPPTDAPAQACDATLYVQTSIEIVKEVQEPYYRECHYKLSAGNIHASEGIWVVRRTNVSVHSNQTNSESSYWYSDLLMPNQGWEFTFRSTYFTDGQISREGVDKVAGVYNRPECLYLLTSQEVESISAPVEWACGP